MVPLTMRKLVAPTKSANTPQALLFEEQPPKVGPRME